MSDVSVVVLIISRKGCTFHDAYKQQWRRYMNSNPRVKSYFIELDPDLHTDYTVSDDTITMKGIECHRPGIYEKTIKAIVICSKMKEYDNTKFFVRTNISAFWIWDRLVSFIDTAPTTRYVSSGLVMPNHCREWVSPHGSNMILSRDVALLLTNYMNDPVKTEADDVAIGGVLNHINKLTIVPYPWFFLLRYIDNNNTENNSIENRIRLAIDNVPKDVFTVRNTMTNYNIPDRVLWRGLYELNSYKLLIDKFYGK